jgi:hypothetical protein
MTHEESPWTLGVIGVITILIIDLIGIVAILVLDVQRTSPFGLWVTAFMAGLVAGAIIGTYAPPRRLALTVVISTLTAAGLLTAMLAVTLQAQRDLSRLYLITGAFQLGGALLGALGGYFSRPKTLEPPAEPPAGEPQSTESSLETNCRGGTPCASESDTSAAGST